MNILVIGGTKFIGPPVVRRLVASGHDVTVFHRGQTHANLPDTVKHLLGDRAHLSDFKSDFQSLSPDVVLDMMPLTEADAQAVMHTFTGMAQRIVGISSQDVYQAYDVFRGVDSGSLQPLPLTENSQLRSRLYPYRDEAAQPDSRFRDYEKILVERIFMSDPALPGTILRLPMVYGIGDYQHRFYPYLRRMDNNRPAILLAEEIAHWRGSWGYVENVAAAIALAVTDQRAQGRIYNVSERSSITEAARILLIGRLAGWQGKVISVPKSLMPSTVKLPYNAEQHWVVDSSRIRTELGFVEPIDYETGISRTIAWERANPPTELVPGAAIGLLDDDIEAELLAILKS
jgi:nucleoside-diphosphate-sugar epimerase